MKTLHVALLVLLVSGIGVKGAGIWNLTWVNNTVFITITKCENAAQGVLEIPATIEGLPVKIIEISAFSGCTNLSKITIPDGVTAIGDGAFLDCKRLWEITIPKSVTSIGGAAFMRTNLQKISLSNSITEIEYKTFYGCINLSDVTIPDSVTSVGSEAFRNCLNLKSVTFGKNVNNIGVSAFRGCSKLTRIEFRGDYPTIGDPTEDPLGVSFHGNVAGAVVLISSKSKGFGKRLSNTPVIILEDLLDSDNDGVPDGEDAFPNDPTEVADCDNDGVGDNADARSGEVIVQLQEQITQLQAQISELSKGQTLEEIQDGRLGSIVITPTPNTNTAILSLDIEHSDDLKTWTLYRKILESIPMPEGKKFYRFALDK